MSNHKAFREAYKDRQIRYLMYIASFTGIYGLYVLFFYPTLVCADINHGVNHFRTISVISLSIIIACIFYKKIKEEYKGIYCDIVSALTLFAYSTWGIFATYYSIIEHRAVNVITSIIIYVISICLLNYSVYVYSAVMIYAVGTTLHLLISLDFEFSLSMLVNYIILAACIYVSGLIRCVYEKKYILADKELRKINKEISVQNEDLANLNQTQKLFTASMSHELRNPLNGSICAFEMLAADNTLSAEQKEFVLQGLQSSKSLLYIINDLLDYSKMESGEFKIINTEFDFREIIYSTKNMFKMFAKEKGNIINYHIDEDMPCILYGDGNRIFQILSNLLSNAIKYTDQGTIDVNIDIKDDILTIEVADTGEGIKDDVIGDLFTPYHRVQEIQHKKIKGTGLGLYIAKSLCNSMGGDIKVVSTYGQGSAFTATIKLKVVNSDITYKIPLAKKEGNYSKNTAYSNLKVLIVDDSQINLTVAKGLLKKRLNITAEGVLSGNDCLDLLRYKEYDIIFLDHMMPDMDGVETLKHIKEMDVNSKIIALTANVSAESKEKYLNYGFDDFLAKPIVFEKLKELIDKC